MVQECCSLENEVSGPSIVWNGERTKTELCSYRSLLLYLRQLSFRHLSEEIISTSSSQHPVLFPCDGFESSSTRRLRRRTENGLENSEDLSVSERSIRTRSCVAIPYPALQSSESAINVNSWIAEREDGLTWASGFSVVTRKVEQGSQSISPGSTQPISSTSESFLHHSSTLSTRATVSKQ